ncbi:hypothetical protein CERSUDRAFT_54517 [Gelatoporia subvermispora B]|uniref:Uncharacterized protein n=1 Tax=Ceriporiopsis subvermispora (strain B) TaxID=914234 RepID=M2PFS5_CERS8|nr:hypothetical protein CERSUDRAFT_54517 [Gelatoporia subvermispora B]
MAQSSIAPQPGKCRIAELVQYSCGDEANSKGERQFHCWPIPRIFRICPGRPAVELTRYAEVDVNTGEVTIPPESRRVLPKGKQWRDVTRTEQ